MKDFKEILLEKLKVSGNINNYNYNTVYWDKYAFERMITFIIYDNDVTDSFFKNNPEEKIPEAYLAFYPEDEEGNDVDYNGLFEYCKGKNLKEIPIETEDVEKINKAKDKLLEKANALASKVYEEAAKNNQNAETNQTAEKEEKKEDKDDTVVDAEYEEK